MMPIFLTVDEDIDEPPDVAPSRSVEAVERVMLGVNAEELDAYTYEVMFELLPEVSAHCTET